MKKTAFILLTALAAGVATGLLIAACSVQGLVCTAVETRCGQFCVDLSNDRRNCGSCGIGCQPLQVCSNGACRCQDGTVACDGGICTATVSDRFNCGACGVSCGITQVCSRGQCVQGCTLESLRTDRENCGQCGQACGPAQNCHQGSCVYDVVAACPDNGTVVGIQDAPSRDGGRDRPVVIPISGARPQALGTLRVFPDTFLLVAEDGPLKQLLQVRPADNPPVTLSQRASLAGTPAHLWAEDPYIYVVSSPSSTLQIFKRVDPDPDGGTVDGGVRLDGGQTLALLDGGAPQSIAKVGDFLYIPLRGAPASAGVIQVDVSDAGQPTQTRGFDLSAISLPRFDGGAALASPSSASTFGDAGVLYVALANLRPPPSTDVAGPGLLGQINLDAGVSAAGLSLGDGCLNTSWVVATSDTIYASCSGQTTFDAGFPLATQGSELVALNLDGGRFGVWIPPCDGGCSLGRFAVVGNHIYVGDQFGGRLFVLEKTDAGLSQSPDGGLIFVCPDAGLSRVSDVISVP